MNKKVVTFGEIMLRLSTPGHQRIQQAQAFDVTYAGSEANVAVSLAQLNINAFYVTRVPDSLIGMAAIGNLQRYGVNTSYVAKGGRRLGIYYLESGSAQRPSKVIYDRANSSIAEAAPSDFDWEKIFNQSSWFHFTGITPALGYNVASITKDAVRAAKKSGLTTSVDLNYRKNLWSTDKAKKVMSGLVEDVDLCIANEEDAANVFGIEAEAANVSEGKIDGASYKEVAKKLNKEFGFKYVAITLRESFSASHNGWSGLLYDGIDFYISKRYDITPIVDRVGGGDSFGAGLIYSLLSAKKHQDAIEFATASSCLKHTIPGDYNLITSAEVELLMKGDASGRVQR